MQRICAIPIALRARQRCLCCAVFPLISKKGSTKTPVITIDQVRAVLAEKSGQGKTKEVKALLYKYDAGKLSGVKPEDYPALMEEAQKL